MTCSIYYISPHLSHFSIPKRIICYETALQNSLIRVYISRKLYDIIKIKCIINYMIKILLKQNLILKKW